MKDYSAPMLALAFAETEHCIASGELLEVTLEVKTALEADPHAQILVFDQVTSELIDLILGGVCKKSRSVCRARAMRLH
jgi:hypothetical protein